jgi:hypothetical protein
MSLTRRGDAPTSPRALRAGEKYGGERCAGLTGAERVGKMTVPVGG